MTSPETTPAERTAPADSHTPEVAVLPRPCARLEAAIRAGGGAVSDDFETAQGVVVDPDLDPEELVNHLPTNPGSPLRWIQLPRAGIERFSSAIAVRNDLTWTSAKGCYSVPVAEHAVALTLSLLRHIPDRVRASTWGRPEGRSLPDCRAVVIGAGGVGSEIVRLLKAFGTHVTVVRKRPETVELADATVTVAELGRALETTDIVLVAAALTSSTRHLIGPRELEALRRGAFLVNVARGELVDTDALVAALRSGQLAGAGLDVTDPEPLPDHHELWSLPQVLITPHSADTPEMRAPLYADRVRSNVLRFASGDPLLGVVDLAAGY